MHARLIALSLVACGMMACSSPRQESLEVAAQRAPGLMAVSKGRADAPAQEISGAGPGAREFAAAQQEPMIVRRAEVSVRVDDVLTAARDLEAKTKAMGGYLSASRLDQGSNEPVAHLTARIPAKKLDAYLDALPKVGTILSRNLSGEDVGLEFHDLQAQLKNWNAEERRLQELFTRANKIPDLLEVERELARVRGQLDQAIGRRDYLINLVTLATVTVDLSQKVTPQAPPGWNPGSVLREAGASLVSALIGLLTLGIWIVVFVPIWLPASLFARRTWRRRKSKAASAPN